MVDVQRANDVGKEEGMIARNELCAVCVSQLNSRLTRLDLLRGPSHIMKKMDSFLCDICKDKIIAAGVRGSQRL